MGDSEAGEMDLDGDASSFNDNKVAEFAGKEEKRTPPSPVEDMLVDMEETAEKLFFSETEDAFPSLADFACLSSPSASASFSSAASTLPKPSNSSSSSSSSFSSSSPWSFLLGSTEIGGTHQAAAEVASEDPLVSTNDTGFDILGDEIDLWETCMEPIESTWDSSQSFFLDERNCAAGSSGVSGGAELQAANAETVGILSGGDDCPSEDLANVFLDWLKRNKDTISPEDLRSIKLKRSTIECAARRLGGGKQGRVQLLKLILAWVQNHHLQKRKRRNRGLEATARDQELRNDPPPPPPPPQIASTSNSNIDLYYDAVPCNSWIPYAGETSFPQPPVLPAGYIDEAVAVAAPPYHYCNDQAFSAQPWQQGLSPVSTSSVLHFSQMPVPAPAPAPYLQQLPVYYTGQMASATKEARKKRMARHRKSSSLHHYRSQQPQNQQQQQQQSFDTVVVTDESSSANSVVNKDNSSNSSFLSTLPADMPAASSAAAAVAPSPTAMARMQEESYLHQRTASPVERRRGGLKAENNYKFLLRKVLKQSDVGSLGRIVLPKKEAEIHLPELDSRDGIAIEMEDIGASKVWNMRYRFWPNNKSRMYVLENTGDFVRTNELQEGDFIVIYSDAKCGKYMIRGVKVRQPPMDAVKGGSSRGSGKALQKQENGRSSMDEKGKSICAEEC